MIVTAGYTSTIPVGGQLVFSLSFTKVVFGNSGGKKLVLPIEDVDTGDLSSITVEMEYLFALQF